ncbi:MVB12B [Bugula neritina]|uniref:MVB12B n=1 Tax=Bugula neritina TaxID=10212 RepID=A0A7J7KLB2_BUGNE|nr:MVB12B [Bugula neritina]
MVDDLPITGLCIVEQTCPPGYLMIDKCEDNSKAEADLWKDQFFAKKVKRFLCITRVFPLAQGTLNNVLVDVCLHDEKELPPAGFSTISTCQDTQEVALKKRLMSVKLIPRDQTSNAINDLQFLSKARKAPPGYTLVGELNGLLLCYRFGPVPNSTPPPVPPRPQPVVQQTEIKPYHIPVQAASLQSHSDSPGDEVTSLRFRSRENIEHEFDYPFFVERQAQHTHHNYNGM